MVTSCKLEIETFIDCALSEESLLTLSVKLQCIRLNRILPAICSLYSDPLPYIMQSTTYTVRTRRAYFGMVSADPVVLDDPSDSANTVYLSRDNIPGICVFERYRMIVLL